MDGWTIGFAVGALVALVVVVLLLVLIWLAARIAGRAEAILDALLAARANTAGLARLGTTNLLVDRITEAAGSAREVMEGSADER